MRTFTLNRNTDTIGVSGTGTVVEGVQFTDGTVAMRWLTATATTSLVDSIDDVIAIHGHEGATTVLWDDETTSKVLEEGKTVAIITDDRYNGLVGKVISKNEIAFDQAQWHVEFPDGLTLWFRDEELIVHG